MLRGAGADLTQALSLVRLGETQRGGCETWDDQCCSHSFTWPEWGADSCSREGSGGSSLFLVSHNRDKVTEISHSERGESRREQVSRVAEKLPGQGVA